MSRVKRVSAGELRDMGIALEDEPYADAEYDAYEQPRPSEVPVPVSVLQSFAWIALFLFLLGAAITLFGVAFKYAPAEPGVLMPKLVDTNGLALLAAVGLAVFGLFTWAVFSVISLMAYTLVEIRDRL